MATAPSMLMTVGEQFYTLASFIDEATEMGISKRIPVTAVPEGMVKGVSKLFVAHPKAILKVTAPGRTLQDLAYDLLQEGLYSQEQWVGMVELDKPFWTGSEVRANDFVPDAMLDITCAFSKLPANRQAELVEEYSLEFCMGVFGWSTFSAFEYVLPHNETELPSELAHLDGVVEPVHVIYTDDEEQDDTDR